MRYSLSYNVNNINTWIEFQYQNIKKEFDQMLGHLSSQWMLILDFAAWLCISLGVSGSISLLHSDSFNSRSWLYRERNWERQARLYEDLFRVKKWKSWLPDGAVVSRKAFRKKRLVNSDSLYLEKFLQETCRAELLHWIIFLFCSVFFIWNPWYVGIIMILYAAATNLPCVITQRYNRIRLERVFSAKFPSED
jgi:glycosyl-4,4'-diaponeurosporenoate acyltransferase